MVRKIWRRLPAYDYYYISDGAAASCLQPDTMSLFANRFVFLLFAQRAPIQFLASISLHYDFAEIMQTQNAYHMPIRRLISPIRFCQNAIDRHMVAT